MYAYKQIKTHLHSDKYIFTNTEIHRYAQINTYSQTQKKHGYTQTKIYSHTHNI